MLTKKVEWADIKSKKILYGIQIKVDKWDQWHYVCEGKNPCLYQTQKERDEKIKAIKKEAKSADLYRDEDEDDIRPY